MEISEADEGFPSKEQALRALESLLGTDTSEGILAMYERAAWNAGATVVETEALYRRRPR